MSEFDHVMPDMERRGTFSAPWKETAMSEWRGLHHHEHEYPSDSGAYCRTCAASYYDPQWVRTCPQGHEDGDE